LPKNFHNLDKPEKTKHEKEKFLCFFIFRPEQALDVSKNVSEPKKSGLGNKSVKFKPEADLKATFEKQHGTQRRCQLF
jgi:hypothetical protein